MLILWVLFLQEFNNNIRDKKGMENMVVDQLSRLENPKMKELKENEISDDFPKEYLIVIAGEEPWYTKNVNYLASGYLPKV